MKVKELRNWLADLGEKNKQHFLRGQRRSKKKPLSGEEPSDKDFAIIERKPSTADTSPTSSQGELSPQTQVNQLELAFFPSGENEISETLLSSTSSRAAVEDLTHPIASSLGANFELQQDLESLAPTNLRSKQPQQASKWLTASAGVGSWDDLDFPDPTFSQSLGSSYDESDSNSAEDYGRFSDPTSSSRPNPDYVRRNTVGGVHGLNDMSREHFSLIQKHTSALDSIRLSNPGHNNIKLQPNTTGAKANSMHDAKIFGNRTLTAGTLDFICNEGTPKEKRPVLNCIVERSDDDTSSSLSSRSGSSQPSIAPDAMDSKLARHFLGEEHGQSMQQDVSYQSNQPVLVPRRKKVDPKDLDFLKGNDDAAYAKRFIPVQRRSAVSAGIRKFGGPSKNIVERRKEQLETLWSESKEATHVKKVKWGVCQRTGTYKKKIVLDVQPK